MKGDTEVEGDVVGGVAGASRVSKRRFLALLAGGFGAAAGSTVLGAACTAPAAGPSAPEGSTSSKTPVSIRFTTWWAPLETHLGTIKDEFEASHPIKVTLEMVPSEFVPKMQASLVAGTWGDASICENSVQVKFEEAGMHQDLTDRLKRDKINLQDGWSLMGLELWQGKALMLPFDNDPRAIYYNKTAFKESGAKDPWDDQKGKWTWADLVQAAKLTTRTDGTGKITRYGLHWNYTSYQEFSPLVWTMGGNYADWKNLKYTLDDPAVLKTHQMLLQWAKVDKIMMTKEGIAEMMGASGANPFRSGVAAMYHRAAYDVNLMFDAIKDRFEWDVAPFPDMDEGHPGVPVTSGNPHFVPANAAHPDEGYEWIKTLTSDRPQQYFAERKAFVPSNKNAWKSYQTTQPPAHAESFIKWVYGRRHGFHFYNAGMSAAGVAIDEQMDLVYLDKKRLEEALKDANAKANEVMDFGKAKNPFAFTVPKPAETNLARYGVQ
jgi:multiple sugar transport system substrate-binding protein